MYIYIHRRLNEHKKEFQGHNTYTIYIDGLFRCFFHASQKQVIALALTYLKESNEVHTKKKQMSNLV